MASFSVNCLFLFPNFAPTWWRKLFPSAATSRGGETLAASGARKRKFNNLNQ